MKPAVSLALIAIVIGCSSVHDDAQQNGLSPADAAAIRALDSAYVAAWLRDDTTGVMATLAPDAVMMPAGQHPMVGDQVRDFWWPKDGSRTKILTFDRHIDELEGAGDIAWTRGTDSLTFTYQPANSAATIMGNRSMTLAFLRRQPSGEWRISRMMWATRTR